MKESSGFCCSETNCQLCICVRNNATPHAIECFAIVWGILTPFAQYSIELNQARPGRERNIQQLT